jgi:hypothetical protein
MRPGRDQQRRIACRDRIDVNPQGHHAREQRKGWLDMLHAALDAPGFETVDRDPRFHGDGAILVPAQRPVRRGRLVEQDGSDRMTGLSKHRPSAASDRSSRGKEARKTSTPLSLSPA